MTDTKRRALNEQVGSILGYGRATDEERRYTRCAWRHPAGSPVPRLPNFAGTWAGAGLVLDWLAHRTEAFNLYWDGHCGWFFSIDNANPSHAEMPQEAIARACLAWAAARQEQG